MNDQEREETLRRIWEDDSGTETIYELLVTLQSLRLSDTAIYNFLGEIYENERVLCAFRDYYDKLEE